MIDNDRQADKLLLSVIRLARGLVRPNVNDNDRQRDRLARGLVRLNVNDNDRQADKSAG